MTLGRATGRACTGIGRDRSGLGKRAGFQLQSRQAGCGGKPNGRLQRSGQGVDHGGLFIVDGLLGVDIHEMPQAVGQMTASDSGEASGDGP